MAKNAFKKNSDGRFGFSKIIDFGILMLEHKKSVLFLSYSDFKLSKTNYKIFLAYLRLIRLN